MRIINIDMDFFLDNIETGIPFNDIRVPDNQNSPWNEKDVRQFLESNCGLFPKKTINGRIMTEHKDAYYFWRELITGKRLTVPFEVIHVDAHSDLGGGDSAWVFIYEEVLNMPIEERLNIEKFQYRHDLEKLDSGNYLLYAIASHWIKSLTLICHPKWHEDFYRIIMKDSKDNSGYIQMKRFYKKIDFSVNNINDTKQDFELESEIEFKIVRDYRKYNEPMMGNFDFLVMSQSPSYTPASADFILEVIKDYITII